jgi:hypothetical protein
VSDRRHLLVSPWAAGEARFASLGRSFSAFAAGVHPNHCKLRGSIPTAGSSNLLGEEQYIVVTCIISDVA